MAGLPLKSGADFYNLEATRLRLHNLGADPTEVGAGLIYFNTSTGLNTSQKARLYTGSAWKTIAFSEDLDVASNADFLELKERVDLLSGDVDTDAIISNMKEVSAFLEGFAEDASLMDYLNTELGKKFDKSGGTINGAASITGRFKLLSGSILEFVKTDSTSVMLRGNPSNTELQFYNGTVWNDVIHSGNVGDYAPLRKVRQSTIDLNTAANGFYEIGYSGQSATNLPSEWGQGNGLLVDFRDANGYGKLQFLGRGNVNGLWFRAQQGANEPITQDWKQIAFTDSDITGNAGSATKLADNTAFTAWGQKFFENGKPKDVSGALSGVTNINGAITINSSGNVGIGIPNPEYKLHVIGNTFISGFTIAAKFFTKENYGLWRGNSYSTLFADTDVVYNATKHILAGGNVLIGTTTDNGAKLQVKGGISLTADIISASNSTYDKWSLSHANDTLYIQSGKTDGSSVYGKMMLSGINVNNLSLLTIRANNTVINGNVGIGVAEPKKKLHVDGDIYVTGNIIADGEVSGGGAGTEGGNAGGGGAFHSDIIKEGARQTTIAHGLGTDDIVVSIYEKDGVSGRWSIILTDVEIVDANNIIVSFGSATTVEHKVVIMGAVA